ncbi:MAG: ABC transporter permease subunit [Ectothiorhodospiraceae bacterium]|nr:ABC transporter permease subunit [Ectothiorhodospiraceae bacterium]
MMVFTLAMHELRSMFLSPLAWVVLAVITALNAYFFLLYVDLYLQLQPRLAAAANGPGITDIVVAPLFSTAATVLLLVTPLLTMRLISEERRNQTLSLLMSAPISMSEIILGKFLGVFSFVLIMLAFVALMPLSLLAGGSLDIGLWASGLLGLILLLASFCSIGLYISTLTNQPTVAAIGTFGVLLLLWIINLAGLTGSGGGEVLSYLSLLSHYQPLLRGVFSSTDVFYYLLLTGSCLALSIRRLDADRLQH